MALCAFFSLVVAIVFVLPVAESARHVAPQLPNNASDDTVEMMPPMEAWEGVDSDVDAEADRTRAEQEEEARSLRGHAPKKHGKGKHDTQVKPSSNAHKSADPMAALHHQVDALPSSRTRASGDSPVPDGHVSANSREKASASTPHPTNTSAVGVASSSSSTKGAHKQGKHKHGTPKEASVPAASEAVKSQDPMAAVHKDALKVAPPQKNVENHAASARAAHAAKVQEEELPLKYPHQEDFSKPRKQHHKRSVYANNHTLAINKTERKFAWRDAVRHTVEHEASESSDKVSKTSPSVNVSRHKTLDEDMDNGPVKVQNVPEAVAAKVAAEMTPRQAKHEVEPEAEPELETQAAAAQRWRMKHGKGKHKHGTSAHGGRPANRSYESRHDPMKAVHSKTAQPEDSKQASNGGIAHDLHDDVQHSGLSSLAKDVGGDAPNVTNPAPATTASPRKHRHKKVHKKAQSAPPQAAKPKVEDPMLALHHEAMAHDGQSTAAPSGKAPQPAVQKTASASIASGLSKLAADSEKDAKELANMPPEPEPQTQEPVAASEAPQEDAADEAEAPVDDTAMDDLHREVTSANEEDVAEAAAKPASHASVPMVAKEKHTNGLSKLKQEEDEDLPQEVNVDASAASGTRVQKISSVHKRRKHHKIVAGKRRPSESASDTATNSTAVTLMRNAASHINNAITSLDRNVPQPHADEAPEAAGYPDPNDLEYAEK